MIPIYEEQKEKLSLIKKTSKHLPPHLHNSLEMVCVTEGTLEFGVAQELFHMEKGDFAIAFPDVIHHYQVFSSGKNTAVYLFAHPVLAGQLQTSIQNYCPLNPVIKSSDLHHDVKSALNTLIREKTLDPIIGQSYVQIILARCLPQYQMVEKKCIAGEDIVYKTVSYIAAHFKEELTLEKVAKELGVSKYVLSRMFSATFHENFNQYVNEQRLNYVGSLLECTSLSVTQICYDAGFQSQRTFNRAFMEKYRMSPREYRNNFIQTEL